MSTNIKASISDIKQITCVDKTEVGALARKGVKWTALQIIAGNVISLGTIAVPARILSPGDFSLVGMVAILSLVFAHALGQQRG